MEERLQKILAAAGVTSRRDAEQYILAGRVSVNGKIVKELGFKCEPATSQICVDAKPINSLAKVYYLFNKPRAVVTTMDDPQGRRCIADYAKLLPQRIFPVGRLDYNTEGLLLLTNDGAMAQALTHPSHEVKKTYFVKVLGLVAEEKLDELRTGIQLEDGLTAPATIYLRAYNRKQRTTEFSITIHEGRNRQIRRMCDAIGYPVRELRRVELGPLTLGGLGKGKLRELTGEEVARLRQAAGL